MKLFYENYNDLEEAAKNLGLTVAKPTYNRTVVLGGIEVGYKLWVYERPDAASGWRGYEINLEKK